MNRKVFIKRIAQLLAAAPAVASESVSDESRFALLRFDFNFDVRFVPFPDESCGAGPKWFVSCSGKLQDGGDWWAYEYCNKSDIDGTKENCVDAMWRRFKWINDPDGVHV